MHTTLLADVGSMSDIEKMCYSSGCVSNIWYIGFDRGCCDISIATVSTSQGWFQ